MLTSSLLEECTLEHAGGINCKCGQIREEIIPALPENLYSCCLISGKAGIHRSKRLAAMSQELAGGSCPAIEFGKKRRKAVRI